MTSRTPSFSGTAQTNQCRSSWPHRNLALSPLGVRASRSRWRSSGWKSTTSIEPSSGTAMSKYSPLRSLKTSRRGQSPEVSRERPRHSRGRIVTRAPISSNFFSITSFIQGIPSPVAAQDDTMLPRHNQPAPRALLFPTQWNKISVMQMTLRLDDELYRQAKAQAAAQGISVTKLVEEAIREHLSKPSAAPHRHRIRLPVSTAGGGLLPQFRALEEAVDAADLSDDLRSRS